MAGRRAERLLAAARGERLRRHRRGRRPGDPVSPCGRCGSRRGARCRHRPTALATRPADEVSAAGGRGRRATLCAARSRRPRDRVRCPGGAALPRRGDRPPALASRHAPRLRGPGRLLRRGLDAAGGRGARDRQCGRLETRRGHRGVLARDGRHRVDADIRARQLCSPRRRDGRWSRPCADRDALCMHPPRAAVGRDPLAVCLRPARADGERRHAARVSRRPPARDGVVWHRLGVRGVRRDRVHETLGGRRLARHAILHADRERRPCLLHRRPRRPAAR